MVARARARYEIAAEDRASQAVRDVEARMQSLGKTAGAIQGPIGGLSRQFSSLGLLMGRLGGAGALAAIGVGSITAISASAIRAGAAYEQQMGRLEAVIRATGGAAGVSAQEIDRFARRLGRDTLASATGAREAAAALLSFTTITGDTFERVLALSQDLAATFGGELRQRTVQLAKALEDPVRGLASLREAGVSFTAAQQSMIKSMVAAGNQADAQRAILARLSEQVGGAGAGEATGLVGSMDSLGEAWTAFLEQLDRTTGASSLAARGLGVLTHAVDQIDLRLNPDDLIRYNDLMADRARVLAILEQRETALARVRDRGVNPATAERAVAGARARLAAIEEQLSGMRKAREDEQREQSTRRDAAAAAAQARAAAAAQAQRTQDEADALDNLRRSLGSTVLAQRDHAAALERLRIGYARGAIGAAEFLELQRALARQQRAGFSEAIDLSRTFIRPGASGLAAAGARLGAPATDRETPRELKVQTTLLGKIERHLANGQTVAVTV